MEQKISIIIPVYNAGEFIIRCLDSIRQQTYKRLETILLHDCGTDNSVEIIKKYQSEHPNFTCILIENERNLGLSLTRNKGMELATGEFILFMDQDDELTTQDALQVLMDKMQETDADFVIGGTRFLQNNLPKESSYHTLKNKKELYANNGEILEGFFSGEWAVTAWNKLYKKEFLEKNNLHFAPKLLHEDELWAFETAVAANRIAFVNRPTYDYYSLSNPNSITGNVKFQNLEDLKTMWFMMLKIAAEKDLINKSPKATYFLEHFAKTLLSRIIGNKPAWMKFYSEMRGEYAKYAIPEKGILNQSASVAYVAHRTKFDKNFLLYGKFPVVFNRLL